MANHKIERAKQIIMKNRFVKRDKYGFTPADKNKVNINAWVELNRDSQNIGDWLSIIVVNEMAKFYNIDVDKTVSKTKHLYAVGSQLLGYQDATVWGGGFLNDPRKARTFGVYSFLHKHYHRTDVRAVRGPISKSIFDSIGIPCPEVYGDPAILMPRFYKPKVSDVKSYTIVPHYNEWKKYQSEENMLFTFTNDYKKFIDTLCSSEKVISSSLHGIILAESYGIPAVMIQNETNSNILKYRDYYQSTGRNEFKIAKTIEEALDFNQPLPDKNRFKEMQDKLIEAFPVDLWE